MIDAKEVAEKSVERGWDVVMSRDHLVRIIAEEIDRAQNPPKKTRGEEVAEKAIKLEPVPRGETTGFFFFRNSGVGICAFDSDRAPAHVPQAERLEELRAWLAALIDAERADAANAEREKIVERTGAI